LDNVADTKDFKTSSDYAARSVWKKQETNEKTWREWKTPSDRLTTGLGFDHEVKGSCVGHMEHGVG